MNAKVHLTYRTYPILLTFRAIFFVACIFIMATLDLSASDKVLLGNVFVDVVLLVEVFRFYKDTNFEVKYKKTGKNELEWRMVLATCGLGIMTAILWLTPSMGFVTNAIRFIFCSLTVGLFLGITIGEWIFLYRMTKNEA